MYSCACQGFEQWHVGLAGNCKGPTDGSVQIVTLFKWTRKRRHRKFLSSSYHQIIIPSYHHLRRKTVSQFWSKSQRTNRKSSLNPFTKEQRDLIFWGNGVIFRGESANNAQKFIASPKQNDFWFDPHFLLRKFHQANFLGVEKSNVGNRLKRVLAKFRADRSHPRGVNGRSKFRDIFEISRIGR